MPEITAQCNPTAEPVSDVRPAMAFRLGYTAFAAPAWYVLDVACRYAHSQSNADLCLRRIQQAMLNLAGSVQGSPSVSIQAFIQTLDAVLESTLAPDLNGPQFGSPIPKLEELYGHELWQKLQLAIAEISLEPPSLRMCLDFGIALGRFADHTLRFDKERSHADIAAVLDTGIQLRAALGASQSLLRRLKDLSLACPAEILVGLQATSVQALRQLLRIHRERSDIKNYSESDQLANTLRDQIEHELFATTARDMKLATPETETPQKGADGEMAAPAASISSADQSTSPDPIAVVATLPTTTQRRRTSRDEKMDLLCDIIQKRGMRMSAEELVPTISPPNKEVSLGNTKQILADLVRLGRLTNKRDTFGQGYGLPEWS